MTTRKPRKTANTRTPRKRSPTKRTRTTTNTTSSGTKVRNDALVNERSTIDASATEKPGPVDLETGNKTTSVSDRIGGTVLGGLTDSAGKVLTASRDPMLLLPMRLEYKVVNVNNSKNTHIDITQGISQQEMLSASRRTSKLNTNQVLRDSSLKQESLVVNEKQIWFRWFPDDAFAKSGISAINDEEQAALAHFKTAYTAEGTDWFNTENASVMEAWQDFAGQVGVHRAVHLLRHQDTDVSDTTDNLGEILALPDKVVLFYSFNDRLYELAQGNSISDEVRYTPKCLEPDRWLTNFDDAIAKGMGLKLTTQNEVANALNGQWLIAVGISKTNKASEVKAFLEDAIANGEFSFLEQDTPTNNSDTELSAYESNPDKLIDALKQATWFERRQEEEDSDATDMASMLGLDSSVLLQGDNSALTGRKNAEYMARCLLPCLLSAISEWPEGSGFTNKELISFIATYAYARGPLAAVRFKHNPYGILPILSGSDQEVSGNATDSEANIFQFMQEMAVGVMENNQDKTADIAVIEPNDPAVSEKLSEILQLYAVSRRADVGDLRKPTEDAKALNCPLVEDDEHKPADYLKDLRTKSLDSLEDPDYTDRSWPLLYRIVRYALSIVSDYKVSVEKTRTRSLSRKTGATKIPRVNTELRKFKSALAHLETLTTSELEVLMIEVFDLMYYRADAWKTALAWFRLSQQREDNVNGLHIGYYGFLSRLRESSETADTDGYIQAPGLSQAVTAGVLRSASLRFGDESAFNIALSSGRVRTALGMLDLLRQGVTLSEVLGHKIERWLHDNNSDILIYEFRTLYPLYYGSGSKQKRPNVFDGIALAEGSSSDFSAMDSSLQGTAGSARAKAQEDLDALSDLITAEAVHQLTNGNSGAANAWMQVLSGDPVPSRISFTRTQRDGQGSTHRVSFVLSERHFNEDAVNPRIIAEPALAEMARESLRGFAGCKLRIQVYDSSSDLTIPKVTKIVGLQSELALDPVDLVIGGRNEVNVRARRFITRLWRDDEELISQLGPLPDSNIQGFINQTCPVLLDFSYGRYSADSLIQKAVSLRKVTNKARPLEPADMNAGSAEGALSESALIEYLSQGIEALEKRAANLSGRLATLNGQLSASFADIELPAHEILRLEETEAEESDIAHQYQQLEEAREAFDAVLQDASRYSLPEALRPVATEELIDTIEGYGDIIDALVAKIQAKQDKLETAINAQQDNYETRQSAQLVLNQLIAAIQYCTDGDAQPVWPPFVKDTATSPDLESLSDLDTHLNKCKNIRSALSPLMAYLDINTAAQGWMVKQQQAEAEAPTETEDEKPLSQYYGVYIGAPRGPLSSRSRARRSQICGFVIDEWSEFKPASIQNTGLAVNYDTPQNEAPHALLLAVPKDNQLLNWSSESAAEHVVEAINLMQYRALPSEEAAFHKSGGFVFNVVPQKSDDGSTTNRIPTVNWTRVELPSGILNASLQEVTRLSAGSHTAATLNERKTITGKG